MAKIHNQLTIKIKEDSHWGNYLEIVDACSVLNGAALKLYLYFTSMSPGEELDFFPKTFCDLFNVSPSSEKNALQELILNGYLHRVADDYLIFTSNKN